MSKDIKKALEHCIEWNCVDCPNREELGSGETVCRGRLLTDVLEYVSDLEAKLAESDAEIERFKEINSVQKNKIINIDKMYKQSQEEQKQLKQQLAEKDQTIESLQEINQSLGQTCNNDAKEIERLREQLTEEVEKLRAIVKGKVLMVEDGSVDIDKLEEDGFYVIVYRNGATPPQYLKD